LSLIGGKHVKAMVKRLMAKLFTDDMLSNYSFSGKKGEKTILFVGHLLFYLVSIKNMKQKSMYKILFESNFVIISYIILYIYHLISDAIKKQLKFKNIPQNEIEETIKYVLTQAPFNLKRKLTKIP